MAAYRKKKKAAKKKRVRKAFTREPKKRRVAKRPTATKKSQGKKPKTPRRKPKDRSKPPKSHRKKSVAKHPKKKPARPVGRKKPVQPKKRKSQAASLAEAKKLQRKLDRLRRENAKLRDRVKSGKATRADEKAKQREARREARRLAKEREAERLREYGAPPAPKAETREIRKKDLRKRWSHLEKLAKKTKQLPKADPRKRKIDTRKTTGEQRVVTVGYFIDEDSIEQILYDVKRATRTMKGAWAIWMAAVVFAALSDGQLFGSNMRVLVADDPDAASFQVQGVESTGATMTRDGMMIKLEHELEKLIDERSLVKVLFVRVMNFSYKP